MVYWMAGRIDKLVRPTILMKSPNLNYSPRFNSLEQLLKAGILEAEYLIIIKRERSSSIEELALEDCNTILTVQYIFRYSTTTKV